MTFGVACGEFGGREGDGGTPWRTFAAKQKAGKAGRVGAGARSPAVSGNQCPAHTGAGLHLHPVRELGGRGG